MPSPVPSAAPVPAPVPMSAGAIVAVSPRHARAALGVALVAVGALPLLAASLAPLQDWPNHLARVHIEEALLHGDAWWGRIYAVTTFLVPNAALDLALIGLARIRVGADAAGQVFLVATYLLFVAGFAALARASGSRGLARPAVGSLLFYNSLLFWGLLNFLFGVAALMLLLAFWLVERDRPYRSVAIAAGGTAVLFFCHLVAAAAFTFLLACFERPKPRRVAAPRAAALLAPLASLLVLVVLSRVAPHDPVPTLAYAQADSVAHWIGWKVLIFARLPFGSSPLFENVTIAGGVALAILLLAGARLRLRTAASMAVGGLLVLTAAAPERIGTGSMLDERLAVLPVLIGAACARVEWRGSAWRRAAVAVLALLPVSRSALLVVEWRRAERTYAALDESVAGLPPHGMVKLAFGTPLAGIARERIWRPPIAHIETIAVSRDWFAPGVFANPTQQPIALRPPFDSLVQPLDFTSADAARTALRPLTVFCRDGNAAFTGVYVVVLFQTARANRGWLAAASLQEHPSFQLIDACRLADKLQA